MKKMAKQIVMLLLVCGIAVGEMSFGTSYIHPVKTYAQEYIYSGTLDISSKGWSSYNTGLNYNMTGGTAGTIYPGAKLYVLAEQKSSSGILIAYVYSPDLQKNCYVSTKFIKKDEVPEKESEFVTNGILDISSKGWSSYNTGLNYNMTGGTAGTIYPGAELTVINEVKNQHGNNVCYCYSPDLQKYCYVSSRYIRMIETEADDLNTDSEEIVYENNYRKKMVEVALKEHELFGGIKLEEPIKYNYFYTKKTGDSSSAWCADFICWCAEQAGIPMSICPHEIDSVSYKKTTDGYSNYGRCYQGYSLAYVRHLVEYLTKYCNAAYYSVDSKEMSDGTYVPAPGDIIVYRTAKNTYQHVGLVVEYDAVSKMITTVEGNTGSGKYSVGCIGVKHRTYNKAKITSNWFIQGYVSLDYGE